MAPYPHIKIITFILSIFMASWALAGTTSPSLNPDMPEEVRGLVEVSLNKDQYQDLAVQWLKYSQQHPESAFAQVMIYKALYYSGEQDAEKLQTHLTKALEIDPLCPEALTAAMQTSLRHSNPMGTKQECYEFGLKAVRAAPDWANPHTMLYVLSTYLNRPEEARQHLVALLEKGYFTPALIDYGYNMLISAAPGGIIITNGDNDTFPCLALQAAHEMRTDVTIANLSLMTLQPMAKQILTRVPQGFAAAMEISKLEAVEQKFRESRSTYGYMLGNALVEELCMETTAGTLKRPLYLAVTLFPNAANTCSSSLILEGLLQRVVPPAVEGSAEPTTDVAKTYQLFSTEYRLESATDLLTDWDRVPAHSQLVKNYTNILFRLGFDAAAGKQTQIMEFGFDQSLKISAFHHDESTREMVLEYWSKLAPDSEKLKYWQEEKR